LFICKEKCKEEVSIWNPKEHQQGGIYEQQYNMSKECWWTLKVREVPKHQLWQRGVEPIEHNKGVPTIPKKHNKQVPTSTNETQQRCVDEHQHNTTRG